MKRLSKKIALVTGAAGGIGEALARVFAEHGAFVVISDLRHESVVELSQTLNAEGYNTIAKTLNVASQEDWDALASYFREEHGKLDIIANCAGMEMIKEISELSIEDYRLTQAVNTEAALIGPKTLLDLLTTAGQECVGGAAIVNISSLAGIVAVPDQIAYNTSKGAVRHMTKSMAIEFAHHGRNVRVNSIHPGTIDTPMLREAMDEWQRTNKMGTTDMTAIEQAFANTCPMKRIGKPSDIAMGALYLCSDEASYITGHELIIDGGSLASWM